MRLPRDVVHEMRVEPGSPAALATRSTDSLHATLATAHGHREAREVAAADLEAFRGELGRAQELLYAEGSWALLVVLQGPDAAGKDGTIKHVLSGVDPQGCRVASFKQPSPDELAHDYLWRCARELPARGEIGIFNRSHYEEVVVCRVHPELLRAERLPGRPAPGEQLWAERYEDINAFERHLSRNGTKILKVFLHVSAAEQRRRLLARLDDPAKQWKFSPADLAERDFFEDYRHAYEQAISATSTRWAPWYVVPADHKPSLRALVGGLLVDAIDGLELPSPPPPRAPAEEIERARSQLSAG